MTIRSAPSKRAMLSPLAPLVQGPQQMLERHIAGPTRLAIIAEIEQAAGLEMPIDEAEQIGLRRRIDPGIDAVSDDHVEARQVQFLGGREVDGMKSGVGDPGIAAERLANSMCCGIRSMPWKRPCGYAAASRAGVTPCPQPSSHQAKPSARCGGSKPQIRAVKSSQAGESSRTKRRA